MKSILLLLAASLLGGCVNLYKAQLEGKIPKINADEIAITSSTIYGVSATLTESGVKWDGNTKSVDSSELRITSPVGSYHRTIKGAKAIP